MFKLQLGVNKCTNKEYHSDKAWLSSSSLKKILEDPSKFYEEEVLAKKEEEAENTAFDEGSLTHSLILEPNLVAKEYAFYTGMRKQGAEYDAFKAQVSGKTIISAPQRVRCNKNLEAFQRNKTAVALLQGGDAEHSMCQLLQDIPMKARADYINIDKGYIVDVKTSGYPVYKESFLLTMDRYRYALSGALYATIAEITYGKPFDFYFIAIEKPRSLIEPADCNVLKISKATMERGLMECTEAIRLYKKCKERDEWTFPEKMLSEGVEEV